MSAGLLALTLLLHLVIEQARRRRRTSWGPAGHTNRSGKGRLRGCWRGRRLTQDKRHARAADQARQRSSARARRLSGSCCAKTPLQRVVACALEGRALKDFDQAIAGRAGCPLDELGALRRGRHGPPGHSSTLPSGEAHGGLAASAACRAGGAGALAHSVQDRVPVAVHGRRGGRRHPTLPPLRPALAPVWVRRRPCGWRGANASSAPSRVGWLLRGVDGGCGAAPCPSPRSPAGPDGPGPGERDGGGSRAPR